METELPDLELPEYRVLCENPNGEGDLSGPMAASFCQLYTAAPEMPGYIGCKLGYR